ncbi:MAG: hypothetical protein JXR49_06775 [Acidobacteria bacterium]|nr:hypothetical protein [Acidobacteriota bacterium]
MKSIRASILFVAVALIFALLPVQAKDKDKLTFFAFDQTNTVSEGEVRELPSGGVHCQGEILEGNFYLFVPERFGFTPLLGWVKIEMNYSVDANFMGLYWGKWSVDFGEYGYFEGNYSGKLIPFVDHADNFTPKAMLINQSGQLQGTLHNENGDEEWLIKIISGVAEIGTDDGMDYFGEVFIK